MAFRTEKRGVQTRRIQLAHGPLRVSLRLAYQTIRDIDLHRGRLSRDAYVDAILTTAFANIDDPIFDGVRSLVQSLVQAAEE